jgi:CHAD domain-containing protein
MPYRLLPTDPGLQSALRRIADEQLAASLSPLQAGQLSPQDVHDIRKRLKKLRGLLRLVAKGFPGVAAEMAALRDAGRLLAAHRDAEVRLATFDRLCPTCPPALAPLRSALERDRAQAHSAPALGEAAQALADLHGRAAHWRLKGQDAAILKRGLAATRRRAARAMQRAAQSGTDAALHDWRKRAKEFWYQTRLLTPIWPGVMGALAEEAGKLAEDLGQHHDIAVLLAHLPPLPGDASALITERAQAAQAKITARAFARGRRLFAGDPKGMAKLWRGWWRLWRNQAASAPDSA